MISRKLNVLLITLLFLSFLICTLSGVFMRSEFFSLNLRQIHSFSAYVFIFLAVLHIISSYPWIKNLPNVFKSKEINKK